MNNTDSSSIPSSFNNNSSLGTDNNNNTSMSNNNSNFSISTNDNNSSNSTFTGQDVNSVSSRSSVSDFIQIPLLCLTIILAIAYIIIILVRPTFRINKINCLTINLCFTSALLGIVMLIMAIKRVIGDSSSSLPCRLQGFLQDMATCQLMYAHAVIAVSRFLTVVYATKHFFSSTTCLIGCLGSGWLIAILVAIPYLLVDGFACSSSTRANFLSSYTLVATLIVPVMIVLILNIRTFLFVHQSTRRVHAEGAGPGVSHVRDMRLLKTMIATFIVFVVGWIPLFLTQIFSQRFTISTAANSIFQVLPSLSMLIDVILLIYINQPVRLFLIQLISKRNRVNTINTLGNKVKVNAHKH